jgi:hypothetical protein
VILPFYIYERDEAEQNNSRSREYAGHDKNEEFDTFDLVQSFGIAYLKI